MRGIGEEFAGYSLTTDTRYEIALWLYGPPGGGKSTYVEALEGALGPARCVTLSAANVRDKFGLGNIAGKTLAVSAETPSRALSYLDKLNSLISGENLRVEEKYHQGYDLTPRVKLLWCMNTLPQITEANSGIFRRVKLVKLQTVADPDPMLKVELRQSGQMLINIFIAGLKRLRDRERFQIPPSVTQATADYKADNDIVAQFVAEHCEREHDYQQRAQPFIKQFRQWSYDNGIKPPAAPQLVAELERLGFGYKRSDGIWYLGIKLRDQ